MLFSNDAKANTSNNPELIVNRLPENTLYRDEFINHITPLSSGFLLFSTQSGARLYDGYQFIPLIPQTESSDDSPMNVAVHASLEDAAGNIWLATNAGLFQLPKSKASLKKISFSNAPSLLNTDIREITQSNDGMLWLGTLNGVIRLDPKSLETQGYWLEDQQGSKIPSGKVFTLLAHNNKVWVGTNNGLFFIETDDATNYTLQSKLDKAYITSATIIDNTTLWFGADNAGIYKLNTKSGEVILHEPTEQEPLNLKSKNVWYIYKAPSGRVWVSYWNEGVTVYDLQTKKQYSIEHRSIDKNALPGSSVEMITSDHTGMIWIATTNGAASFNPQTISVQHLRHIVENRNSLQIDSINTLAEDDSQITWIGTAIGLERWDPVTNSVQAITTKSEKGKPINTGAIWKLHNINSNYLILASDLGLFRFNKTTHQLTRISPELLAPVSHYSLIKLDGAQYLAANSSAKIYWIDGLTSNAKLVFDASQHSATQHIEYINTMLKANDSSLWFGSPTGVFHVTFENELSGVIDISQHLDNHIVHDLIEDSSGNIWVATANGGIQIIPQNSSSKMHREIASQHGLPSNKVQDLVLFNNQIWFSTFQHFGRIDLQNYSIQTFPQVTTDSLSFFEDCSFKTKRNILYFCGSEVIRFNPDNLSYKRQHYPIKLTGLERMHRSDKRFYPLVDNPFLEFYPEDSLLTFHFSQLDFSASRQHQYQYKLEGYDKQWLSPGRGHSASYTYLPRGNYQFKVRSTNQVGEWSEAETILTMKVYPPLWKTTYAYLLYFTLIALTLFLIFRSRQKKRHKELAAMAAIRRSEENLRDVLWGSGDQYWRWDLRTDIVYRTSKLELNELPKEESFYWPEQFSKIHPDDQSFVKEMIELHLNGHQEYYEAQFRILASDDKTWHWVLSRGRIVEKDHNNQPTLVAGTTKDINDLKVTEDRLRHLANFDQLTQLPNRSMFHEQMKHAIKLAKRYNEKVALLFFDLNGFKIINDSMGHATGDQLLQAVAQRLKTTLRETDNIARLGGDEFMVILERVQNHDDILPTINRLTYELSQPFDLTMQSVMTSASVGIAIYPDNGTTTEELLKNADIAMYEAKKSQKDDYRFYREDMNASLVNRLDIERDLENAIANDQFKTFFQPRVDVQTNKIRGFEALIRWNHPDKGMISPAEFIPVAEESGKILYLGSWILFDACKQCSLWHQDGHKINVSVNIAALQFQQSDLIAIVQQALEAANLAPEYLELEITEGTLIHNLEHTRRVLYDLKKLGIKIALDDFGTGYSSLSYLQQLPIDVLKIDRAFIIQMTRAKKSAMLCKAIINMAHSLGIEVVAEGVETEEQLEFLLNSNCEEYQGFLFGKPQPIEEIDFAASDYHLED